MEKKLHEQLNELIFVLLDSLLCLYLNDGQAQLVESCTVAVVQLCANLLAQLTAANGFYDRAKENYALCMSMRMVSGCRRVLFVANSISRICLFYFSLFFFPILFNSRSLFHSRLFFLLLNLLRIATALGRLSLLAFICAN